MWPSRVVACTEYVVVVGLCLRPHTRGYLYTGHDCLCLRGIRSFTSIHVRVRGQASEALSPLHARKRKRKTKRAVSPCELIEESRRRQTPSPASLNLRPRPSLQVCRKAFSLVLTKAKKKAEETERLFLAALCLFKTPQTIFHGACTGTL